MSSRFILIFVCILYLYIIIIIIYLYLYFCIFSAWFFTFFLACSNTWFFTFHYHTRGISLTVSRFLGFYDDCRYRQSAIGTCCCCCCC